jgi:hypothetical protein
VYGLAWTLPSKDKLGMIAANINTGEFTCYGKYDNESQKLTEYLPNNKLGFEVYARKFGQDACSLS